MKLMWKYNEYPNMLQSSEDYEVFETLIPEPTGDYFLATIDSGGAYQCLEFVPKDEVTIIDA